MHRVIRMPSVWGDTASTVWLSTQRTEEGGPFLSDLVEMFLKENVKDPSIVTTSAGDPIVYGENVDYDVAEIRLNGIIVVRVLNTSAAIQLRAVTPTFAHVIGTDSYVAAADPLLFEKLWEHVATLDAGINCPGWSIIEKGPTPKGPGERFWRPAANSEEAYPGFKDDVDDEHA